MSQPESQMEYGAANGPRHIGVLGGGITGLTAAYYLLREGCRVTVVEAASEPGGLSAHADFGSFQWDRFYHCILTSDRWLRQLMEDLGLAEDLRWRETKVGFYSDGSLYSLSNGWEFLKFPLLSPWQKIRLALGILYTTRIREGRELERIPVATWLTRVFGRQNYEKFWAPLLRCKLGSCREQASASFMWATISRLYSTRDRAGGREKLGHVCGGYKTVFARLLREIESMGGRVILGAPVRAIEGRADGGIDLVVGNARLGFDAALSTVPGPVLSRLAPALSDECCGKLNAVTYLGMVCVVLVLKRQLTPFYVLNLVDRDVPFTGVIEMSNLVPPAELGGSHLVYLPKYTGPGDPLFSASDDEVWTLFASHLSRICPGYSEADVERRFVFRERLVQPLPVLGYSELVPPVRTNIPNLFLANTTQIVNSTFNNNEMVRIARQAVDRILEPAEPRDIFQPATTGVA